MKRKIPEQELLEALVKYENALNKKRGYSERITPEELKERLIGMLGKKYYDTTMHKIYGYYWDDNSEWTKEKVIKDCVGNYSTELW